MKPVSGLDKSNRLQCLKFVATSFCSAQPSIPRRLCQMSHLARLVSEDLEQKSQHSVRIGANNPVVHLLGKHLQNPNAPLANGEAATIRGECRTPRICDNAIFIFCRRNLPRCVGINVLAGCHEGRDVILQQAGLALENIQDDGAGRVDVLIVRCFLHSCQCDPDDSVSVTFVLVQCELFYSVEDKDGVDHRVLLLLWLQWIRISNDRVHALVICSLSVDGVLDQGPKIGGGGQYFAQEAGVVSPLLRTALHRCVRYRFYQVFIDEAIASGHRPNQNRYNSAEIGLFNISHDAGVAQHLANLAQDVDPDVIAVTLNLPYYFASCIVFVGQEESYVFSGIPSCRKELGLPVQVTEEYIIQLAIL